MKLNCNWDAFLSRCLAAVLEAPDWIVDFVRMEPAGDWLGDRASQSHLTPISNF